MMMNSGNGSAAPAADAILRRLARRAAGLNGADVECLVREARQTARRERRNLSWSDLDRRLSASKPVKPESLRWRMALHEAGHAVARLFLRLGTIILISIDSPDGGMVKSAEPPFVEETEEWLSSLLVAKLSGRAAEEVFLGTCIAGSGIGPESDLAAATSLALQMEVSMGFGADQPLLYRSSEEHSSLLIYRPEIAHRVNLRMEKAYANAKELIRTHQAAVEEVARCLIAKDTLEGKDLEEVLALLGGSILHGHDIPKSDGQLGTSGTTPNRNLGQNMSPDRHTRESVVPQLLGVCSAIRRGQLRTVPKDFVVQGFQGTPAAIMAAAGRRRSTWH